MQMKFYSPLAADFFPNEPDYEDEFYDEYEGCPLDGHDLLQYADAVDEAVKKDIADFNGDLMQYYHEDDSVRSKVVSAVPSVEICGNKLCGCLTVELKEPLLDDEQTVLCNYISGQYSDGWGEGFEQRDKAKEMCDRVTASQSYSEALNIISEYVETELSPKPTPKHDRGDAR